MNPPVITREQARQLDGRAVEEYGMNSLVLMENAARGVVELIDNLKLPGPYVVCCGRGNNGGDGFAIARHLDLRGQEVTVVLLDEPAKLTGDAKTNYEILKRSDIRILQGLADLPAALDGAGCVIDALLGTGAKGEPRPPLDEAIALVNAQPAPILAVDLPSGLDCDTGEPASHTITAAHTCTFVAYKPGFLTPQAADYTGAIWVTDIGAPRKLVEEILSGAG